MNIAERYREYTRVIDMCEGTGVHPWGCVKYMGENWKMESRVDLDRRGDYAFAVAILEGKPAFIGDTVYHCNLGKLIVTGKEVFSAFISQYSWNKPKRTFTLEGRELPIPDLDSEPRYFVYVGNLSYRFSTYADQEKFASTVRNILNEAIENARLQSK